MSETPILEQHMLAHLEYLIYSRDDAEEEILSLQAKVGTLNSTISHFKTKLKDARVEIPE